MLKHFVAFAFLAHCVICRFAPDERQWIATDERENCTIKCHEECPKCTIPTYCIEGEEIKCGETPPPTHPDCPASDICVKNNCNCPKKPSCPVKCEKECKEGEKLCSGGTDDDGCEENDYCVPIVPAAGPLGPCPGWCPEECDDDENECPVPNDPLTGCSVPPLCIPKQIDNNGKVCQLQPCSTYCEITTEIKCNGKEDSKGCKEGDTCVPRETSNIAGLCPGICPVECESDEVLCKGQKDCDTGCTEPDQCISKTKNVNDEYCPDDSASHGCPVKCCDDDILCPVKTNAIGCKEKEECKPRSKDNKENFCPQHSDCDTICEPHEVLCPIEGKDENGCDKPDLCIVQERDETGELCTVHCPVECNEDEVLCTGHRNEVGCEEPATCEKIPRKQWGNAEGDLCPGVCPERCEHDEILCPLQLDPCDGCPTEQLCRKKHKDNNGEYCPDDSASHNCPKLCYDSEVVGRPTNNQVLCPVYEDATGCKPEAQCMFRSKDNEGEVCPSTSVCPVQCQSDEIECTDGVDARLCARENLCLPKGKDGDGNTCERNCPVACTGSQTFCKGSTLPNGCQGEGYCTEIGVECIGQCVGDCCWENPSSSSDGDKIAGIDWPIKDVVSVEACAQHCTQTPSCNGFHYYGQNDNYYGDCYIKQSVTGVTTDLDDGRDRYGGICGA